MSAFASAEEPTDQWVDFHAPFNPRGDGYQTPAGRVNGAAVALPGYNWLGFYFGTDSGSSGIIRYPAAICGLFGLRYKSQTVLMEGIAPCCYEFDSMGLLGRDLETFHELVALTVEGGAEDVMKYPGRIFHPTDYLPYTEEPVQAILEEFTVQLEQYLRVSREVINIAEYDEYSVNKQFLEDNRKKFGKDVYFGPYMRWKTWGNGIQGHLEKKGQGLREGTIYRGWFAEHVLRQDKDTASDAVLIMPLSCYAPGYRDNIPQDPHIPIPDSIID
ncbi:hypothetical protein B0T14DRAFT_572039 [Immersiella caudata]|uniref:Amidase domain-containing protein n=1 Tax=Immersiella caudata TaxID=314043 RepID=A0AA39WBG7_9PEZI|nr:hypothetical protein B0T14DRAFT_572039 [Immersiella caudata]